jgi:aminoglycoside 3-N-acetyltransferase I
VNVPTIHRPDVLQLKELLEVFAMAFDDPMSYRSAIPSDVYLANLLEHEDFIPLVAVAEGGVVVGGLAAYVLRKFEQERSEIYIYDLAVDEKYRRRGIATDLINKLREIAREKGAWVIYVQADHGDDPAIKLYESLGTREDVLHFDIMP